jgi:hypothetical protein
MNKPKRMRWAEHVARVKENAYGVLLGEPEGKRPLERLRRMWENNIKMDLREIEWDGTDWSHLAQWRALVNTVMNLRIP